MINTCIHIYAHSYIDKRITDVCLHHRRAHVCVHACERVRMCFWALTYLRRNV